jgi:uncharacterized protein YqeY
MGDSSLREQLRASLGAAMRAKDTTATSALRSALSAIDNAEAVEVPRAPTSVTGPIAGAVLGVGAGEAPRRTLRPEEVVALVQSEIDELVSAAAHYEELGRVEAATRLRAEAAGLAAQLSGTRTTLPSLDPAEKRS